MAQPYIPEEESAYYPPRARWYAGLFYLGHALRGRLALDRLRLPDKVTLPGLAAGFLVPGLAFWLRGPRLWGRAALATVPVLLLIYVVWMGCPAANFAFGLLISLHVTGTTYYCQPMMANEPFASRLRFTFLILLGVGLLLYLPARFYLEERWVIPLRQNGRVMVVERHYQPRNIQRGDWVAYAWQEDEQGPHGNVVWVRAGMGLGPVLAVAGDRVQFSNSLFAVNGRYQPSQPHMPAAGEFIVPENHWFIWPNLDISGHGNVSQASIDSAILGLASVNESQFFGKPPARWCGRQQILP
jgi:hypothetical protein